MNQEGGGQLSNNTTSSLTLGHLAKVKQVRIGAQAQQKHMHLKPSLIQIQGLKQCCLLLVKTEERLYWGPWDLTEAILA